MKVIDSNIGETGLIDNLSDTFKIQATKEAFIALSNSLYNDKIASIIRELTANMLDIHTIKGTNRKPKISITADNIISFRDYGTGLTKEQVKNIYTTYFASTKINKEDQIGGYGLGSKTPFAYTNEFNVISYQNGKKTEYLMFIGNNGPSVLETISDMNTEEDDGLEVFFKIKSYSDVREFIEKIKKFITVNSPKPDDLIVNFEFYEGENMELFKDDRKITYLVSKEEIEDKDLFIKSFEIRHSDKRLNYDSSCIILNGIHYPTIDYFLNRFLDDNCHIFIELNQDKVQPTVSREDIQNRAEVQAAIRTEFKEISKEIFGRYASCDNKGTISYSFKDILQDETACKYFLLSAVGVEGIYNKLDFMHGILDLFYATYMQDTVLRFHNMLDRIPTLVVAAKLINMTIILKEISNCEPRLFQNFTNKETAFFVPKRVFEKMTEIFTRYGIAFVEERLPVLDKNQKAISKKATYNVFAENGIIVKKELNIRDYDKVLVIEGTNLEKRKGHYFCLRNLFKDEIDKLPVIVLSNAKYYEYQENHSTKYLNFNDFCLESNLDKYAEYLEVEMLELGVYKTYFSLIEEYAETELEKIIVKKIHFYMDNLAIFNSRYTNIAYYLKSDFENDSSIASISKYLKDHFSGMWNYYDDKISEKMFNLLKAVIKEYGLTKTFEIMNKED